MREKIIKIVLLNCILSGMSEGLSYEEGKAMFKAGVLVMEEVSKFPNTPDEELEKMIEDFLESELAKI